MTWVNQGMYRRDVAAGHRWAILQPSGARFNSADNNDPNVYLNGVVVDPLIAVQYDIANVANAPGHPVNGRLGEYISVAAAIAAPTAGAGTIDQVTGVARGRKMVVANTVGKNVAEWDSRTGKTTALGQDLGRNSNFNEALIDIANALKPPEPVVEESDDLTRIFVGVDQIVDSLLNIWTINDDPAVAVVGALLQNGTNFQGAVADQAIYIDSEIQHHNPNTGRWYLWDGATWVDQGFIDPTLPDPSVDWFTVPDDGDHLIDDEGVRYELGSAAGAGFNLLKAGAPWTTPDGGGAWGDKIKIGTGVPPRLVDHRNPLGLGWIHPSGTTWTPPHADHEGGVITPVEGTTIGSIPGGALNVVDVLSTTGFAIGDDVYVEPLLRTGQGPGGQWPFTAYANAAARNAAASQWPAGKHVLQLDTNVVWVKNSGGGWTLAEEYFGSPRFYQTQGRSLGHWGRITNITGNQLVLDRSAQRSVANAIVHWSAARKLLNYIQTATNGASPSSPTLIKVDLLFPGRTALCIDGFIVPQNKQNIHLTCESTAVLLYSPPGANSLCFQWLNCSGIVHEVVQMQGNWTVADYGLGWQGSTPVAPISGYLDDFASGGGLYPVGCEFRGGSNNEQRDYTITNVPIRAAGGQSSTNLRVRRVRNLMTSKLMDYIQWQMQADNCDNALFEDCEVDSDTLIAGFELFHCRGGGGIVRPKGRNATIAINDSGGGWKLFRDPASPGLGTGELRYNTGCVIPLESTPYYNSYANQAPSVNINHNGGTANVAGGGSVNDAVIVHEGYVDSLNRNYKSVAVAGQLPSIIINGIDARYPSPRVAGVGAVGLQTEGINMLPITVRNVKVQGPALNVATDWNIFVTNGTDGGGNVCNVGGKNFNGVIT